MNKPTAFEALDVGFDIPAVPGMDEADIQTPCLVLDLDALERNIKKMGDYARAHGMRHRVHGPGHTRIKRQRAEFDFEVQKGNYVPRDVVRQATATIFSGMVQTMRSLSDNLERQGVAPELCVKVDAAVNEVLAQVGQDLQMIGGVD